MREVNPIQSGTEGSNVRPNLDKFPLTIKKEAKETLHYLQSREAFWEQILVGNKSIHHTSFGGKAVESLRLEFPN